MESRIMFTNNFYKNYLILPVGMKLLLAFSVFLFVS